MDKLKKVLKAVKNTAKLHGCKTSLVLVGWIAFVVGIYVPNIECKLLCMAVSRVLP